MSRHDAGYKRCKAGTERTDNTEWKNVPNSGSIVFYIGCGSDTDDQETLREADTESAQCTMDFNDFESLKGSMKMKGSIQRFSGIEAMVLLILPVRG